MQSLSLAWNDKEKVSKALYQLHYPKWRLVSLISRKQFVAECSEGSFSLGGLVA